MDDPKSLKKILAEELTIRIHGESAYLNAMQVSELMFNKDCTSEFLKSLNLESFNQLKTELPLTSLDQNILKTEMSVLTFLSEYTQIFSSKSEARRAIQANALSVNKNKVLNAEQLISLDDFLLNRYILVENGKKNKYIIEVFA
jgi:tyrosyl-tRNA synthetase